VTLELEEKQDLSVYYFIENVLSSYPYITITDSFPSGELSLPTVAVTPKDIEAFQFQLGSKQRVKDRTWYVDVFANNTAQARKIGYKVLSALEDDVLVKDYDEGLPPDVTNQTVLGLLEVENLRLEIIKVMPDLVDKLYYRAVVYFTARYNQA